MFTRTDYLQGKCTHAQYYSQLVTPSIKALVQQFIGTDRLLASKDEHLNDIPLHEWDNVARYVKADYNAVQDNRSLSGDVCVLKEAARQIIKQTKESQEVTRNV